MTSAMVSISDTYQKLLEALSKPNVDNKATRLTMRIRLSGALSDGVTNSSTALRKKRYTESTH
jgi:hypothetical protein